jgi:hypothetical protein
MVERLLSPSPPPSRIAETREVSLSPDNAVFRDRITSLVHEPVIGTRTNTDTPTSTLPTLARCLPAPLPAHHLRTPPGLASAPKAPRP